MDKLLKWSFLIAIIGAVTAIGAKLYHLENPELFLLLVAMPALVFVVCAIVEIYNSARIRRGEKIMWAVGLLFTGLIAGCLYMFVARKRIVVRGA